MNTTRDITIPRSLLESMPTDWQAEFTRMLLDLNTVEVEPHAPPYVQPPIPGLDHL